MARGPGSEWNLPEAPEIIISEKVLPQRILLLFPNPVTDNLYVQHPFAKGSMEITDMNGRIVWKEIINASVIAVPVQQLAKGVYVIGVRSDGRVFTEKFIKQ